MKDAAQFDSGGGPGEVYYTIAEVCALLKISKPTFWRYCKYDGLRKVKMGGAVRIRKSVLDKWISEHEAGAV